MSVSDSLTEKIRQYALLNATKHGGKAEVGAVVSKILGAHPELRLQAKLIVEVVKQVVEEINALKPEEQLAELENYPTISTETKTEEKRLPPLPNAVKGAVVVRLPPEPSGYMHIGHAMAGLINSEYAKMYDGKIWLRFEDTNPRKVKLEYYDSFRSGYSWLGIKWDYEKNVSDDLDLIYGFGRQLVEKGLAYACTCEESRIKAARFAGKGCECRERSVEENLEAWDKMLSGAYREGEIVIRYKGDLSSQDYSLRDPNLFRIVDHPHPIQGSKYRLWPVYDFAVVVEDYLCKVTHILRSLEFHVSLQDRLRADLGLPKVHITQFSRFRFKGTPVSKRMLRPLLEQGLVSGWDDPRMPTIMGLKRRGIDPEAIKNFTLEVGYTLAEHEFEWSLLFAANRKVLDPKVRRYMFVPDPIRLKVKGAPEKSVNLRFHPDKDLGFRAIQTKGIFYIARSDASNLHTGDEFRLIELYNVVVEEVSEDEIKSVYIGSELKEGIPKFQWVTEDNTALKVLIPDVLFKDDEFNRESLNEVRGFAEPSVAKLKVGEVVQFIRFGFCRIDSEGVAIFAHK
ncbi:MAG: glutamate--tRNA ligase [Nitrososphaerales archaeon]